MQNEKFSSKWGLLVSVLGIAVGTGNVWRFPRIAAQNAGSDGAGGFLIIWLLFLLLWSIPLIIAEYAIGKKNRRGLTRSFMNELGPKSGWMGSFIGFVAIAIMFYYSVVTGWCLYYLGQSIFFDLPGNAQLAIDQWDSFQSSSYPVVFHLVAVLSCVLIVSKGIKFIERVNKVLIPLLVVILLISLFNALLLDTKFTGLKFLFTIDWSTISNPQIWLEALTQNAWDTGAGWGLIFTYAIYMQKRDKIKITAFQTGIGNNLVSMMAAIIIFSTVFSVLSATMGQEEILNIMKESGPSSTGLTFIWMPQLFKTMVAGKLLAILFFLGLSFAAFSSLISMVELATVFGIDLGFKRKKVVIIVGIVTALAGIPSAMNTSFFANQDFVWGVALMISGLFISYLLNKVDIRLFISDAFNKGGANETIGNWWIYLIRYFIPIEAIILLSWWIIRSATEFAPDSWYNPFSPFSVSSVIIQWLIMIGISLAVNGLFIKKMKTE